MSQNKDPKKAHDELCEQLRYLKLQFIQQHFDELAKQAASAQWSHVEFLCRLIDGEAQIDRRASDAGPYSYVFEHPAEVQCVVYGGVLERKECSANSSRVAERAAYAGLSFWTVGYCVSMVGLDEETIRKYIREQEKLDDGKEALDFGGA